MKTGTIKVDYLARVEGEGALYIKVKGGAVEEVRLKIFEPPRFFEAFLRGRHYSEAPDITSRICGICPVAYQMSAVHAMNFDKLSLLAQEASREAGLSSECRNPFRSVIVRSVEVLYACDEALRIIDEYEPPDKAAVEIVPRAGVGYGCTEAPRGLLYHRYRIDEQGLIADAKIVPPTSQNQKRIEADLRQFVSGRLDLPKGQLTRRCEQAVRNYDPCISCATHFLRLEIERE
jgi:coenzyme F420-reducing hydrogenase alpha subunit